MKFSKRLASMLFEIYPEAIRVVLICNSTNFAEVEFEDWNDDIKIPCTPPDDGKPTEYKRDDVFVYDDSIEITDHGKRDWREVRFICYNETDSITTDDGIHHIKLVKKIQPKEEMIGILVKCYVEGSHEGYVDKQIPKSEAIKLGLIDE